jgi:hypothetical protein
MSAGAVEAELSFSKTSNRSAEYRAGADQILNGVNHGPFGEKNFFIPNGHGPYGPSRAMRRVLPVAGHAVDHVWEAGAVLASWIWSLSGRPGRASR